MAESKTSSLAPRSAERCEPPRALVYIGSGCPHCPAVLEGLTRLVKDGRLAQLEVVNLSVAGPVTGDVVRSVPWMRIGPFELVGSIPAAELADWVERAATGEGWAAYYAHLLEHRRLDEVERLVHERPGTLIDLLDLLGDTGTPMALRIGIGALLEGLAGGPILAAAVPLLAQLTLSDLPQTRADACHFLGLAGDPQAIPAVRRLLDDEQPDVREIAGETLALLGADPAEYGGP
jgi:HEAT repeats